MTVELMVEGVPAGTPKAAVLTETDVERQRSPAVASDCSSGIPPGARGSVRRIAPEMRHEQQSGRPR